MRNAMSLAVFSLLAGLAVAGSVKQEPVTYLEGDVVGVVPNAGGSLVFPDDKQVELRTGLATVAVPYANVTKATLGKVREQSSNEPLYKVWTLHKRIMKDQLQKVTIDFKNMDGESKKMTLELGKSAATHLVRTIHEANEDADTGQKAEAASVNQSNSWWGDSAWKTTRNAQQWPSSPASNTQK